MSAYDRLPTDIDGLDLLPTAGCATRTRRSVFR
jgi:hypothetical protein